MANWLNQLHSLLGQNGSSSSSSGEQGLSKLLVPGALGGLAGLLVANKSSRKLLSKYGTSALLVGGGAVAGTVLWNKYKDKIRAAHRGEPQFGAQKYAAGCAHRTADRRWSSPRKVMAISMPTSGRQSNSNCVKPA